MANPRLMSLKDLASGLVVAISDLFIFDKSPLAASESKERLIEALSQTDKKSLEQQHGVCFEQDKPIAISYPL